MVTSGIRPYEGSWFTRWFAWANGPGGSEEGPLRPLKLLARADEKRLRRKVR